jgi:hypothetical protein
MNRSHARKPLLSALVLTAALAAPALPAAAADFWTGTTTITRLYPQSSGGMYFVTAYTNTAASTCDGGSRWQLPMTAPNYNAQVAALMLAFSQGLLVNLHVPDQAPTCAPEIDRFHVNR